ncbi:Zinc finger protein 532 [Manis javanica]|nr:Zinc finger protein 532 [Manis javanica]
MEHDNVVRKCHRYRVSEALTSEAVAHFLMLVALKMRECDLVHHHRLRDVVKASTVFTQQECDCVTVTEHWSRVFPKGQGSQEHLIKFMTMGDMKTPGFDDLLAVFDISDMVYPKAAIESGHDEQESHIEQHARAADASHTLPLLMLVSALSAPLQAAVVTSAVAPAELTPKQVTIKPVATAFFPLSAVKMAGSQVINLKLANSTTVKATVISATSVQSSSSTIIKAANAIQQQSVVVLASSLASAKGCAPRQP